MKIYNYHPKTGRFTKVTEARVDPRDPKRFLIPRNAVKIKPPKVAEDMEALWEDGRWVVRKKPSVTPPVTVPDDSEIFVHVSWKNLKEYIRNEIKAATATSSTRKSN